MTTSPQVLDASPGTGTDPVARWFRVAALVEAVSWTCLLIGMFFKYVVVQDEIGVQVFGPIHGAAFVAYVAATVLAGVRYGWSWRLTLVALAASIPPLATWPLERHVSRKGLLRR